MERRRNVFSAKLKLLFFVSAMMFHIPSYASEVNQMAQLTSLWRHHKEEEGTSEWLSPSVSEVRSWCSEEDNDSGNMEDDLIKGGLPGQPSGVEFKQYAGYVNVNKSHGRNLFYYFVEATDSPSSKPLVLWLNGGPGSSSLGFGAMLELGPFGVNPDGKTLYRRPYAWNKVANMLFLESPVGVGFSYSDNRSDHLTSGDRRTAHDTYIFLLNWLRRFPHYKARDFFITGESYAGYYIPELADVIMKSNKERVSDLLIQLKGIMIGNGVMNAWTDQRGVYDYVWSHALISVETHRGLVNNCFDRSRIKICRTYGKKMWDEIGNIDPYSIYSPQCPAKPTSQRQSPRQEGYDPCESNYVNAYLNLLHVQKALHVNTTKLPYPWKMENLDIYHNWKDSPLTMFPIYKRLVGSGLRILLYSGDTDSVVPVTSTLYSIAAMNRTVIRHWHPWTDKTQEAAGYKVVYDGLTFVTIRGAGHTVPQFRPQRSLALFKNFLTNS